MTADQINELRDTFRVAMMDWDVPVSVKIDDDYAEVSFELWRTKFEASFCLHNDTWQTLDDCAHGMNLHLDECNLLWWDDGSPKPEWAGKSRPAMFFPKHLYPLAPQARCVAVKAERVQDISEEDAIAEGIIGVGEAGSVGFGKFCYAKLWDSINAERGKGELKGQYAWKRNPWVFATTFELLD